MNSPSLTAQQYLNILTYSKDATVIYVSEELHIGFINNAMMALWRKTASIVNKRLVDAAPEFEPFIPILNKVWLTGEAYIAEDTPANIDEDGILTTKYFDFEYRPVLDEQGKTYAIINTATDISERKKNLELIKENIQKENALKQKQTDTVAALRTVTETLANVQSQLGVSTEKLAQSEGHFKEILSQAPVGIALLSGPEHTITIVNKSILNIWGRTEEEVLGKPHHIARPELKGQPVYQWLDEVYSTGIPRVNNEFRVMLKDRANGGLREAIVNSIYQPMRDAKGAITGVMVILDERTEMIKARLEVEHAQEMLNIAIDAAELATFYYNPNTNLFSGNDLLKSWFGLADQSIINLEDAIAAIHEEDRLRVTEAVIHSLDYASGGHYDIEYNIANPAMGALRMVRAKGRASFNEQKQPISLNGTLQDITEIKKDEQRKNDFISMVSHELKTPLTSLSAYLQVLQAMKQQDEDEFTIEALEKAGNQVKKMTAMINGFLNLSRLEAGKIVLSKKRFNLRELIDEVQEEFNITTSSHTIKLLQCNEVYVQADRNKIEQVLNNLLTNAAKYSPHANTIELSCTADKEKVTVCIRDFGIGIKPEDHKKLFERFYRVDTEQAQSISGFGIGLYLSAEIIYRHNGHIWVESEYGQGASFYFTLPID